MVCSKRNTLNCQLCSVKTVAQRRRGKISNKEEKNPVSILLQSLDCTPVKTGSLKTYTLLTIVYNNMKSL